MRVFRIRWLDSCYFPQPCPDEETAVREAGGTIMETVGFVHYEDENSIGLSMEVFGFDHDPRHIVYIPKVLILEQCELDT
jgi:hypothetical protein